MPNKQTIVKNKAKEIIKLGNSLFPVGYINPDKVEFRFTLYGKVAGKACYDKNGKSTLWFHPALIERDMESYLEQTVAHEVAHLFQRKIYPYSKPHGREFKSIARKLGDDGSRCHSLDTKGIGKLKTRYLYKCKCGTEFKFTKNKHTKQLTYIRYDSKGNTGYICRKCRNRMTWTGEIIQFR